MTPQQRVTYTHHAYAKWWDVTRHVHDDPPAWDSIRAALAAFVIEDATTRGTPILPCRMTTRPVVHHPDYTDREWSPTLWGDDPNTPPDWYRVTVYVDLWTSDHQEPTTEPVT